MGLVLGGTERHQHLSTGAIPASRDRVLGEKHADVAAVLHCLRADVRDCELSELDRGVFAKYMRHSVRFEFRPGLPDGGARRQEELVRRLVWHLHDKERHHCLRGRTFPLRVVAPQLGGSFRFSGGTGQQDGVEPPSLSGEVEPDVVLE